MATVEPKALYKVSPAEPQMTYFTVSIAQGAFLDTDSNNGGRVSPCVASDFATKPTTLAESKKVSRGNLRWKMMMESIGIRTNFKVHNIVTTYSSDAGDNPITTLAFGLVFDNPDYIPTTGTTIDGSTTTTTKAQYIRDKIAEALNSTRTENMSVFDPTETSSVVDQELRNLKITAAPVMTVSTGEIVDAITVTEVSAFAPNTSGQLVADVSLTYTEE
tara:strand:+ start:1433 stop:2086 length:654 start_codon:yes stop_codon:yes gene_type:complete